jgi:hypothetical protein
MEGLNRSDTQDKGLLSLSNLLTRGEELSNHYVLVQFNLVQCPSRAKSSGSSAFPS